LDDGHYPGLQLIPLICEERGTGSRSCLSPHYLARRL